MEYSIFLDREDANSVEEEEKNSFVKDVLTELGIELDEAWPDPELTVEQKIKLRELLKKFNIIVLEDQEKNVSIYLENDVIAEWERPQFILHRDLKQIDPRKKIYLEMKVNARSIFEEYDEENSENDSYNSGS